MADQQGNGLDGKVAIVTGGARGLGRQYGVRLAQAGAAVVLADRSDCTDSLAAVVAAGGDGIAVDVDVAESASTQAMAQQAMDKYGRIDVLVNNAALYGGLSSGPFDRLDEAEWDACMAVNVKGIWNCCKAVVTPMRAQAAVRFP